ncbi:MAG: hypothetical protein ACI8VW_002529 [bacterium]|jgi:hypothetical protein
MFKRMLVLTGAVFLAACSSSSPSTPITAGDGTRAGAYIGDFGSGNGVYVVSGTNALSGLALSTDGSAHSLFGELGTGSTFVGDLRSFFHTGSSPANQGVFGAGRVGTASPNPAATAFNLNILEGQTIESLSGSPANLTAAAAGALSASSPAEIAGTWSGEHRYCNDPIDLINNCSKLITEITFAGNTVSGRTVLLNPEDVENFENLITGSIAQLGSLSTLAFTWKGFSYNGSIFFLPGSTTQLVFLGETRTGGADNPTIASLLTR